MEALLILLGLSASNMSAEQMQSAVSTAVSLLRDFKGGVIAALNLPTSASMDEVLATLRQQRDARLSLLNILGLSTATPSEELLKKVAELKSNGSQLNEQVAALSRFQTEVQTATGRSSPDEARAQLSAFGKLHGHVAKLTGKNTLEEQVAELTLMQTAAKDAESLRTELSELKNKDADRALDDMIRVAEDDGRVTPGNKAAALSMKEFGSKALQTFLSGLPKTDAVRPPAVAPPAPSVPGSTPSPEGAARAQKLLGVKGDDFKRAWEEHKAAEEKKKPQQPLR